MSGITIELKVTLLVASGNEFLDTLPNTSISLPNNFKFRLLKIGNCKTGRRRPSVSMYIILL